MIHGDLKGVCPQLLGWCFSYPTNFNTKANILIDQTGHACLADFGLLTIISDPTNHLSSSSYIQGGTARWMSPELIDPQRFGFKDSCPTKSSDCYALGMVIYETISGCFPFHQHADLTVFVKVLAGEHPLRGKWFTTSLWKMLEQCWMSQPNNRPNIGDVLQFLESGTHLHGLEPPSQQPNPENGHTVLASAGGDSNSSAPHEPIEAAPRSIGSGGMVMPISISPGFVHNESTNNFSPTYVRGSILDHGGKTWKAKATFSCKLSSSLSLMGLLMHLCRHCCCR